MENKNITRGKHLTGQEKARQKDGGQAQKTQK